MHFLIELQINYLTDIFRDFSYNCFAVSKRTGVLIICSSIFVFNTDSDLKVTLFGTSTLFKQLSKYMYENPA
jgi:hypothetical protein